MMKEGKYTTRREFMKLVGATVPLAVVAACAPTAPPAAPAPTSMPAAPAPAVQATAAPVYDPKKYAGTTIRVMSQDNHIWAQLVNEKEAEFEEVTGITLNLELFPDVRKQTGLEFSTGSSTADVFASALAQDGMKYYAAKYYTDLMPLIDSAEQTDPAFNMADFTPKVMESARQNGVTVGIPIWTECSMLCYHKELLEQAGVTKNPWDWSFVDMAEAAAAVRKLGSDIYGVAARGTAGQAAGMFSPWLFSFGGNWLDQDGNPALATPEALSAFEAYGAIVRESGPPNSTALDWSKSREFLLQNKSAMWLDTSPLMPLDPEKFAPVERFGYARTPAGPTGIRSPQVSGWLVALYGGSKNPGAAWRFMQWATSPEFQLALSDKGILPSRLSVYGTDEFKAGLAASQPDFIRSAQFAVESGHGTWLPPFVNVLEARDVVGQVIQQAINGVGGDELKQAAEKCNTELARIRSESGI